MLDTKEFVKRLAELGYSHICAVPCSFAKFLINEAINSPAIEYVPCASEAVACSISAGLTLGGKKPIMVIQSSGLTNAGSCITSLLKPYGIKFPIITSWRTYKEGDSEIQHKLLATNLPKLIDAYGYRYQILNTDSVDTAIEQIEISRKESIINVIREGTFGEVELEEVHRLNLDKYVPRSRFLEALNKRFGGSEVVFVGTTGNTSREMYHIMKETKNFYMVGNMGGALSVGLGIAKTGRRVIVLGGDAEFVMHMGGLTTAGRYKEVDLSYVLFDNESNKSTGGQATYQDHVDYIGIAKSSGFNAYAKTIYTPDELISALKLEGLNFYHVKCGYDRVMPRPPVEAIAIRSL